MIAKLPDRRLRLAFLGTPEIAKVMLERLLDTNEDDVVLVLCQPDKPKGRGKVVEAPPVKALAEARGIEVLQPVKLKDGVIAERLAAEKLDLAIVVAYGRILPNAVFEAPAAGTWNVHASLLPKHRGASPINHAILAGEPETGVTLMQLSAGLDEGDMLYVQKIRIADDDTTGSLTEKLAKLGADALIDGIRAAKKTGLPITPQNSAEATFAPLLEKEHGKLDFTQPARELERRIRALSPWPGTFVSQRDGQPIKILRARVATDLPGVPAPGVVLQAGPRLVLQTREAALEILELQSPGKKPMSAADWLRGSGRHLQIGALFPDC